MGAVVLCVCAVCVLTCRCPPVLPGPVGGPYTALAAAAAALALNPKSTSNMRRPRPSCLPGQPPRFFTGLPLRPSCPTSCRAGVHVSLGFFEDIVVPQYGLPEPSFYKADEQARRSTAQRSIAAFFVGWCCWALQGDSFTRCTGPPPWMLRAVSQAATQPGRRLGGQQSERTRHMLCATTARPAAPSRAPRCGSGAWMGMTFTLSARCPSDSRRRQ